MNKYWNYFKKNYLWRLRRVPKVLQIEVTNRCNSNCEVCPRKKLGLKPKDMTYEEFKEIIDNLYDHGYRGKIQELHPYRAGEPTLNDELTKMLRYAREWLKTDIVLYTNGSWLTEQMIDELFEIPIKKLVFSVEGYGKKQYEQLRKGMSWKHLCDMIKYACKRRHYYDGNTPEVIIRYTKYKDHKYIGERYRKKFPIADHVIGRDYVDTNEFMNPVLPCEFQKTHMIFDAHRNLLPCCCLVNGDKDMFVIGSWGDFMVEHGDLINLTEGDIIKYWRRKTKEFRKQMKHFIPLFCFHCGKDVINKDNRWY